MAAATPVLSLASTVRLANGVHMPLYGYGTSHQGGWSDAACKVAIESGVKLFDTAKRYGSEPLLARALASSGVAAGDVFLTTKLWPGDEGDVPGAFEASRAALGVDVVDLYLVHWPGGAHGNDGSVARANQRRLETWRQLERLYDSGRVRAIGVSNFLERHLEPLVEACSVRPMVRQPAVPSSSI